MLKRIFRLFWKMAIWFFGLSILSVIIFRFVPVPFTPLMISRAIDFKMEGKDIIWSHDWISIEEMPKNIKKAVIASEDGKFLTHYGFDFEAIEKAIEHNEKGKRIRGGSTITQQTAKNVFLWQGRSFVRKGLEAYFTVLIEIFWSKERIMEVYLNSIEMGNGVYGIQAAAKHWYGKDAKDLKNREAAGIAAILPNPRKFKASNSSSYIERRKTRILKHMQYVENFDF